MAKLTQQQFDARLQRIRDEYQTRRTRINAKRDQEISVLFFESGWTQQEIGDHLGRSHQYVSYRLRFGRFCKYFATVVAKLPVNLTERRFRQFWEQHGGRVTANTPAERKKFQAIIDSDEWQVEMAGGERFPMTELICEHCVDNKWRTVDEIQEATEAPDRRVPNIINRIRAENAGGLMVQEKKFAGGVPKYKFKKISKAAAKARAIEVLVELEPIIDDIQRGLSETVTRDAVKIVKGQMPRLKALLAKYK